MLFFQAASGWRRREIRQDGVIRGCAVVSRRSDPQASDSGRKPGLLPGEDQV